MNLLFLTVYNLNSIQDSGIYQDLLREFVKKGDHVYVVSPNERRFDGKTHVIEEPHCRILQVKTLNQQKCSMVEKGLGILLLERQYIQAIKKYFSDVTFDLVLYSTPPVTFAKVVQFVKKRDNAKTYLLLKDIFPQNAVDLGMLKTTGLKGFLYRYFRAKEKKLYAISDKIGCMSPANCQYLCEHNPKIPSDRVEVCPNCCQIKDISLADDECLTMRKKYNLPVNKKILVYGGNLGQPQGIPFIIDCLRSQINNPEVFFLIVGKGTEYHKLEAFIEEARPSNMVLMQQLPKEDYDHMIAACDVGLIFLDYRFTIPNFPSRLLSYLQAGLPVLACTDNATDMGSLLEENQLGWSCPSNSVEEFTKTVAVAISSTHDPQRSIQFLKSHYNAKLACDIIYNACSPDKLSQCASS